MLLAALEILHHVAVPAVTELQLLRGLIEICYMLKCELCCWHSVWPHSSGSLFCENRWVHAFKLCWSDCRKCKLRIATLSENFASCNGCVETLNTCASITAARQIECIDCPMQATEFETVSEQLLCCIRRCSKRALNSSRKKQSSAEA